MAKKKDKIRYNRGSWTSSRRCMNCNALPLLKSEGYDRKKFENSGKYINENDEVVQCVCDKGWFHSKGRITS